MNALHTFTEAAAERYTSGRQSAGNDALTLDLIASKIVELVDALEPLSDKLDVARDVDFGHYIRRSEFSREAIAVDLANAFSDHMLSVEAASVLLAMVRAEAG